jgi:hypothetical protein
MAGSFPSLKDKRVRGLVLLAGFTFLFIILAMVALTIRSGETQPQMQPHQLFPELDVNAVAKVLVATSEASFEVVRTPEGNWVVPSKANFPAKLDTVKKTVLGVKGLNLVEAKTRRKDAHEYLELGAPEEKGKAVSLTLQDASGKTLAAILTGKVETHAGGNTPGTLFVRRPGEDQTWLASGNLRIDRSVTDWIETDLFKVDRERIQRAEIAPEGATAYTLVREGEDKPDFTLTTAIPAGKEPSSSAALNGVGAAVVGMTFEDVQPQGTLDFGKGSRATFTTFDGLIVAMSIIKGAEDKYWATVQASANPPPPAPPTPAPASPDAPPPDQAAQDQAARVAAETAEALKKKAAEDAERVTKEAATINARTSGWAFNLPKFKGDGLTTKLDTLLKDKSAEPAPEPPPPP